jgi:tetratricopeptide (TPR) repeat protein
MDAVESVAYGEAAKAAGTAAFSAGDMDAALEHYDEAVVMFAAAPAAPRVMASVHANRSLCYMKLGRGGEAAAAAALAVEADGGWERGHMRLGVALQAQGDHAAALRALQRSHALKADAAVAQAIAASEDVVSPRPVLCVLITANGGGGEAPLLREPITLQSDDPRFAAAHASPMLQRVGAPFAVHRMATGGGAAADNQFATNFMADVRTGVAPPQWQGAVGDVVFLRSDRRDAAPGHALGVWSWLCDTLAVWGAGEAQYYDPDAYANSWLTKAEFLAYFQKDEWGSRLDWDF